MAGEPFPFTKFAYGSDKQPINSIQVDYFQGGQAKSRIGHGQRYRRRLIKVLTQAEYNQAVTHYQAQGGTPTASFTVTLPDDGATVVRYVSPPQILEQVKPGLFRVAFDVVYV